MADPYGGNIDANRASLAERSDPNFAATKIATRVRELRIDVDGHVNGVNEASVLAVLDDSATAKDVGGAQVTECAGVASPTGAALLLSSDTGAILIAGVAPVVSTQPLKLGFHAATPVVQAGPTALLGGANISGGFAQAEVQAVSDKLDDVITILTNLGLTT